MRLKRLECLLGKLQHINYNQSYQRGLLTFTVGSVDTGKHQVTYLQSEYHLQLPCESSINEHLTHGYITRICCVDGQIIWSLDDVGCRVEAESENEQRVVLQPAGAHQDSDRDEGSCQLSQNRQQKATGRLKASFHSLQHFHTERKEMMSAAAAQTGRRQLTS